jgi:L-seryl-tRNA(Ser) seleniumtransferase
MKTSVKMELFRQLPSVDEVPRRSDISLLAAQHGSSALTEATRAVLGRLRNEIASGLLDSDSLRLALDGMRGAIEQELRRALAYSLRPVINATGVILHTNLGRAPLAASALEHIRETGGTYSNLEYDVEVGERGKRDVHVQRLFRRLLSEGTDNLDHAARLRQRGRGEAAVPTWAGKNSTVVVNNNAAAVLLALNTLAEGGEVIVSRGELVEIGGSFRIPDVMGKSGAVLREVGTTNRTRLADYEKAINERTRLLLRVHRSNFEISGFTEQASTAELAELARRRSLPLMEDLGSGALVNLENFGIHRESNVLDSLRAGVDAVTYSGDKLLGGPQAGVITGREDLVGRMRANSLFRALRVDKLTYAALEATLLAYVKHDYETIPALRMMRLTKEEIGARAEKLVVRIRSGENLHLGRTERGKDGAPTKVKIEVVDGESVIGGGAAPSSVLPTRLLAVTCSDLSADELAARLRASDPPIVARVEEGRVLLDLRTVFVEQEALIATALNRID